MKKEARLLKEKSIASLIVSVDHFNRSWDVGRQEVVLMLLDHSFEMLLKSAILVRGGRIRDRGEKNTIGFDACVRRGLSDGSCKFLTNEQALVLQALNGLRDAAQHHLLELSESHLYLHTQSGVTLFRDLLNHVFDEDLGTYLPDRTLPVSTLAPLDPITIFDNEVSEIKKLLSPRRRSRMEALARLRGLAIVDGALRGERLQPGEGELKAIGDMVAKGAAFEQVFPGISGVQFVATGSGPALSLRISNKEGIPVQLVPEGTEGAAVVAVKRVDELGFYNLGLRELANHLGLTNNKASALVWHERIQEDRDCFKEIRIGRIVHKRYSQESIDRLRKALDRHAIEQYWAAYRSRQRIVESTTAGPRRRRKSA